MKKLADQRTDSVGEISRFAICRLRKKFADATSANLLILGFIITSLHLTNTQVHTCCRDWILKSAKFRGIPWNSVYFRKQNYVRVGTKIIL